MSTVRKRRALPVKVEPLAPADLERARAAAQRLRENREAIRRRVGYIDVSALVRETRDDAEGSDSRENA